MALETNPTRRSPPKTPCTKPLTTSTTSTPSKNVKSTTGLHKRRGIPHIVLPIPLLTTAFLLWLSVILFGYSRFYAMWHASSIHHSMPFRNHTLQQQQSPEAPNSKGPFPSNQTIIPAESEQPSNDEEESSEIIHIIHTRFMQRQPHLIDLALARLKLFEAFFLRSLEEQTSSNFLCLIRTDPNLDDRIRQLLIQVLENSNLAPSYYLLIASNENPRSQYQSLLEDVKPVQVWSGSWVDAQEYIGRSADAVEDDDEHYRILESRLDADDGLSRFFVETIQQEASDFFDFEPPTWRIWCAGRHVEWQFHTPWESSTAISDCGSIVTLQFVGCITAGLTTGYSSRGRNTFPNTKHESLHVSVPDCGTSGSSTMQSNCLSFLQLTPTALRARTPTSAGMLNVLWHQKNHTSRMTKNYLAGASKQHIFQERLWLVVDQVFGFSQETAREVRQYLQHHMRAIAHDNLQGQCTEGHSCKNTSQELLQTIVESSKP